MIKNLTMEAYWHPSMNRWRDQSGMAHIVFGKKGPACGARPYALGGAFATPEETGSPTCKRCKEIEARNAGNHTDKPRQDVQDPIKEES